MVAVFSVSSFLIGFLLGLLLMLILVWIAWFTRTAAFVNCPSTVRACVGDDYYNDPGEAIANTGVSASQILYVENGRLYYKRVPRNGTCAPEGNQIVRIAYPKFCSFSGTGFNGVTGTDRYFNANMYTLAGIPTPSPITTMENCDPDPGQIATEGTPIAAWTPISYPSRTLVT